jgi:hypothetical protein
VAGTLIAGQERMEVDAQARAVIRRTRRVKNVSGGTLALGDVVVRAPASATKDSLAVSTTTTEDSPTVVGMVLETIANNGYGRILTDGFTRYLKVDGTDDIAVGDMLSTFSTVKIAQKTTGAGAFAYALEAYTANNSSGVIDALIMIHERPLA